MKIFDFIDKLREKQNEKKEKPQEKPEKKKKDLGTCIPLHALSEKDRKKKLQEDDSLEKDLKKKKKPVEEIDYIDNQFIKETKIKDDDIDVPAFGIRNQKNSLKEKTFEEKAENLIELDEQTHKKRVQAEEEKEIEEQLIIPKKEIRHDNSNLFRINGIYDFGTTTMISGIVERGNISIKMKAEKNGKSIEVTEIKMGPTKVRALNKGEEGSLFVKTKGTLLIKYDDLLEFS